MVISFIFAPDQRTGKYSPSPRDYWEQWKDIKECKDINWW